MNAATYCRVSSEAQRDRHTIDSQRRILPQYVREQGWELVKAYEDEGKSAETIEARPGFKQLLADLGKGLFDVVVVIDLDRLSRSEEIHSIYQQFRDRGCLVATPSMGVINLSQKEGYLNAGIRGLLSFYEKESIKERCFRGKIEKAKHGRYIGGRLPIGYGRGPGDSIVVVEQEAAFVRYIMRLVAEDGLTVPSIREQLEAEGVPSRYGGKWWTSTVQRILENTAYYGRFRFNRRDRRGRRKPEEEVVEIEIPAIVTKEYWDLVQKTLTDHRRFSARNRRHNYLCSGLLRCGSCGSNVTGCGSGSYYYYRCWNARNKRYGLPCDVPHFPVAKVDAAVWDIFKQLLSNPQILRELVLSFHRDDEKPELERKLQRSNRDIAQKGKETERVVKLYRRGLIPEQICNRQLREIGTEREVLEKERNFIKSRLQSLEASAGNIRYLEALMGVLGRKLTHFLDFGTRRSLIKAVIGDGGIVIRRDGEIEIYADPSLSELLATNHISWGADALSISIRSGFPNLS